MARTLKNSRINPEGIDADDAYNRAVNRGDSVDKALEDPQPGPVENRGEKLRRDDAGS